VSVQAVESLPPPNLKTVPTIAEMKSEFESKCISLADTAVKGQDFDKLVTLLYASRDVMATSLLDLPGTDVMLHRIDTGDSPPIRTRQFRHSPSDRAEIDRQVQEMLSSGVMIEAQSPWCSPVLLLHKRNGERRFLSRSAPP
jgi:hypothetical protein